MSPYYTYGLRSYEDSCGKTDIYFTRSYLWHKMGRHMWKPLHFIIYNILSSLSRSLLSSIIVTTTTIIRLQFPLNNPFYRFCLSQYHMQMHHANMQVSRRPMVSTISSSSWFFENIKPFRCQTSILMCWICICYFRVKFILNPSVCLSPTFLPKLFINV